MRRILTMAVLALAVVPAAADARIAQGACTARDLKGAECGTFPVPLDHADPGRGTIDIAYALYPARKGSQGTVVLIPGGPGQGAVGLAGDLAKGSLSVLRDRYDLVFADPRGTGRSAPLRCSAAPKGTLRTSATTIESLARTVGRCGNELGDRRRLFSTSEQVRDLDDLRNFLEVPKIIPLGVSYGGQVAGAYARTFPDRTQAVVLDSTSPIEGIDQLGRLPQVALPRVLRDTCFPPGCEQFGDPFGLLEGTVERLRSGPLSGRVALATGKTRRASLTMKDLYELILTSDVDPFTRTDLPAALQAANKGDAAPLLRALARLSGGGGGASDINEVRLLATSCTEGSLPWSPDSDPAGRATLLRETLTEQAAAYAPFDVAAVESDVPAALCVGWPATPPPPPTPSTGRGPDVPVLVLAGRQDLRTPLEDQRRTAAQYPSATVVAVPEVGHSVLTNDLSNCSRVTLRAFLTGRPVGRCARRTQTLPVALPAFRTVDAIPAAALRGAAPGRVGRTVVAVDLTLRDMARQLVGLEGESAAVGLGKEAIRIAGLRGGVIRVTEEGAKLVNYEHVGGVRVSGSLGAAGAATLRVTGSGATGTVALTRGGLLRGTLDGVRFRYRPRTGA